MFSWTTVTLLSFIIFGVSASINSKIVELNGGPKDYKDFQELQTSWSGCQVACMQDDTCVMIYEVSDSLCHLFQFGQVSSVQRQLYPENRIGFKMEFSEELCPASNPTITSTPLVASRITDNVLYTTTISFNSEQWTLGYNITSCPNNTTLFLREEKAVCIGLFLFGTPECNLQTEASAMCKKNNGTLTGPANSDEYAVIQALSKETYNTSNQAGWKYLTYWIDGTGLSGRYNYAFEDPTHNGITNYQWAESCPLYSGPGYCLYNPNALGFYISDLDCNTKTYNGLICWRGALCQVKTTVTNF